MATSGAAVAAPSDCGESRSCVPSATSECFDVLDRSGRFLGLVKRRSSVHRDGDWHRAVHIWLAHSERREILIQLRAACKDSWPEHWDVGCAGHLSAGESSITAAHAELEEELGIRLPRVGDGEGQGGAGEGDGVRPRLELLATLPRELVSQGGRFIDREVVDVYLLLGRYELRDMTLQQDEVQAVRYIALDEYVQRLQTAEPGFVPFPDLADYKQRVFDVIQQRLSVCQP